MNFKTKILTRLLPVLAAMLVLFGSCMTVCAAEDYPDIKDVEGLYAYNFVYQKDGAYYLISSDVSFYWNESSVKGLYGSASGRFYTYQVGSDGGWMRSSGGSVTKDDRFSVVSFLNGASTLIESDYDILDKQGNVFFQGPSPLYRVAAAIQPTMVQKEILSLLPLLIPCLIGFLGLRKGLRFLSSILRAA